jgi:hypothetical protein
MLKSYLLANIRDRQLIETANGLWRTRISELCAAEDKTESDFIKHWLRAKYADTIRERRKDALPQDFDIIGTAPHKWVRDNKDEIGLRKPGDYADLISRDFKRLSARFLQLLGAAQRLTPGFEHVFYNAWNGFTLQFPLILAAVTPVDDDETFQLKVQMVAGYIDLFVARRMVNFRNFGYSTVQYTMFNLIKDIRDLDPSELAQVLGTRVAEMEDTFDATAGYALHQRNGPHVKYLLARMTAWLEHECAGALTFADLVDRHRKDPFEIEHIWADHAERHPEFPTEQAFEDQRNRFGGLLLLPKSFNASYGDNVYPKKLEHYFGHNLLARSLHERCYQNNPQFVGLVTRTGLSFVAHPGDFTVETMIQRQGLYQALLETIFDPATIGLDVPEGVAPATAPTRTQQYYGVPFSDLVTAELIRPDAELVGTRSGRSATATVTADGQIALPDGTIHDSPSSAAMRALEIEACNGWQFWRVATPAGAVKLARVRQQYLERSPNPDPPARAE